MYWFDVLNYKLIHANIRNEKRKQKTKVKLIVNKINLNVNSKKKTCSLKILNFSIFHSFAHTSEQRDYMGVEGECISERSRE